MAFLYGDSLKPQGSYTGGSLTAVMGGIELDLRGADIKDGSVIEVFTLCGGCNIILPDNVTLKNDVQGIFGGISDETNPKKSSKKSLTVRGVCVFGGLEIK